ncbi:HK97 family phage prohead protease [Agrobacterium sp. MAFF310724]|uniref:HK97 family phage prohead protease n=1 Tax=Agrobacterium TaxID=357 RepID=UPI001EEDAE66|nr:MULTISPECIES: HK97 family phage prohead protease [Agrobacterium]MDA5240643.1 HK97 family phage prohead protease [Agrobacterium sp. MAFF310724]MDA5249818.1 HK97 family phage prohead protease [Agrobacterium sp. MAFF210268]
MTIEKRAATDVTASGRKLTGYVATFGTETRIADFRETIRAGAFADSLRSNPDVLGLVDHDPGKVLARTKSGSLVLAEDARGLRFELELPDTQLGRDIAALAARGDVGGMSFGFNVPDGGDEWAGELRTLKAIDLREISVVQAFPAYDGTSVSVRSRKPMTDAERRIRILELEGGAHVAV